MTMFNAPVMERPETLERLRDAENALKRGDKPQPVSLGAGIEGTIERISAAGRIALWDTKTGGVNEFNDVNTVKQALQWKYPDGTYRFTTTDPHIPQPVATYPCKLHKDAADREFFAKRGLEVCRKVLKTEDDVETHMKSRHKREWEALKQAREREKEAEERLVRRAIIQQSSGGQQVTAKVETPQPVAQTVPPEPPIGKPWRTEASQRGGLAMEQKCDSCDHVVTGSAKIALINKMSAHRRKAHAVGQAG